MMVNPGTGDLIMGQSFVRGSDEKYHKLITKGTNELASMVARTCQVGEQKVPVLHYCTRTIVSFHLLIILLIALFTEFNALIVNYLIVAFFCFFFVSYNLILKRHPRV
jgi:hypothetical protein